MKIKLKPFIILNYVKDKNIKITLHYQGIMSIWMSNMNDNMKKITIL